MRFFLSLLASLLLLAAGQSIPMGAPPFATAVVTPAMIGQWNLCGDISSISGCVPASSTVAYDSSGGGDNGTWNGTQAGTNYWYKTAPGTLPYAGYFNGTDDYVDLGTAPANLQLTSQVTVTAWILQTTTGSNTAFFGNLEVSPTTNGYELLQNAGHNPFFQIAKAGTVVATSYTGTALSTGVWHFLAGTYNGTQVCMYVDGSLLGSCVASTMGIGLNPTHAAIGTRADFSRKTPVTMNQVHIYNYGMTSTQISAAYAAGH